MWNRVVRVLEQLSKHSGIMGITYRKIQQFDTPYSVGLFGFYLVHIYVITPGGGGWRDMSCVSELRG